MKKCPKINQPFKKRLCCYFLKIGLGYEAFKSILISEGISSLVPSSNTYLADFDRPT